MATQAEHLSARQTYRIMILSLLLGFGTFNFIAWLAHTAESWLKDLNWWKLGGGIGILIALSTTPGAAVLIMRWIAIWKDNSTIAEQMREEKNVVKTEGTPP